jgi:hypothetical protein
MITMYRKVFNAEGISELKTINAEKDQMPLLKPLGWTLNPNGVSEVVPAPVVPEEEEEEEEEEQD